jgi:spermidine synthase
MVYELALSTLASYILGSTVRQFSIVLGVYLSAMGVGAFVSARVSSDLWRRFLELELIVALVGGLSAPLLLLSVAEGGLFSALLYASVFVVGGLVGAELPLLIRSLEGAAPFKEIVGRGFAFDYLGALVASVLFPLALVPLLGLVRTCALAGISSGAVALAGTWALPGAREGKARTLRALGSLTVVLLAVVMASADMVVAHAAD